MIKVVAKNKVREQEMNTYNELVKNLIHETRKEEGCIKYELFQDVHNFNILTFVEEWEDLEALEKHKKSSHFTKYVPMLDELCEESGVNVYSKII